jgi:hypothetical protein
MLCASLRDCGRVIKLPPVLWWCLLHVRLVEAYRVELGRRGRIWFPSRCSLRLGRVLALILRLQWDLFRLLDWIVTAHLAISPNCLHGNSSRVLAPPLILYVVWDFLAWKHEIVFLVMLLIITCGSWRRPLPRFDYDAHLIMALIENILMAFLWILSIVIWTVHVHQAFA